MHETTFKAQTDILHSKKMEMIIFLQYRIALLKIYDQTIYPNAGSQYR